MNGEKKGPPVMFSHHSFHNFVRLSKNIKICDENKTFASNTSSTQYPMVKFYL